MKIRYDFVTNSSSTSFVIINDGEFNLKDFLVGIGIRHDSKFGDIFEGLFDAFESSLTPIREHYDREKKGYDDFEDYITSRFSRSILDKILLAENAGKKVYAGYLDSDGGEIESFFCTDSFIIEGDNFFIDATEDAW